MGEINEFKIYLSNIYNVILHNTALPNNIIGREETDLEGTKEIYRQLKNASGKQGDKVSEMRYERREMEILEAIFKKEQNWRDLLVLLTNKYSNDYGHNWVLALQLLFITSLYLFVLGKLILVEFRFDTPVSFVHVAQFTNFMINPLHKFNEVFPGHDNAAYKGLAECVDIIGRLFSGYMIFQFLRAFRKYARP